jgi:hypothetical protein
MTDPQKAVRKGLQLANRSLGTFTSRGAQAYAVELGHVGAERDPLTRRVMDGVARAVAEYARGEL